MGMRIDCEWVWRILLGDENVLNPDWVMMVHFGKFTGQLLFVHLKWVNFIISKLYFNNVVFKSVLSFRIDFSHLQLLRSQQGKTVENRSLQRIM